VPLQISEKLAKELGAATTVVVAAAVGAAVAGSVGGAVGGAMSGSAAPGSPAPVQNLIAKVQFAAMTGGMATDVPAYKGFAGSLKWMTMTEGGPDDDVDADMMDAHSSNGSKASDGDGVSSANDTKMEQKLRRRRRLLVVEATAEDAETGHSSLMNVMFFFVSCSLGLGLLFAILSIIVCVCKCCCGCGGGEKTIKTIAHIFAYLFFLIVSTLHLGVVYATFSVFKCGEFGTESWVLWTAVGSFVLIGLGWPFLIWWKMTFTVEEDWFYFPIEEGEAESGDESDEEGQDIEASKLALPASPPMDSVA
jgi:hypothetical protein